MEHKNYTQTRDWYGETLVKLAREDRNVVALDCDLGRSTKSFRITEVDENRFIEMGIAEQDMISTAAGLAKMGKIPFANSFAIFITGRAFDQIRQQVALPKSNVKICGSSAGITQGPDGATHQSVLDAGIMRTLPNMVVLSPADGFQTQKAVRAAHAYDGPVYLRLSRYSTGSFLPENIDFTIGNAIELRKGDDIVLVSWGPILKNVLDAADILDEKGLTPGVVNFHTLKPLDVDMVKQLIDNYKYIVSVEEHSIYGALGTAVSEAIAEEKTGKPGGKLLRLGILDTFGESGTAKDLLKKHGLDAEAIADSVVEYCT